MSERVSVNFYEDKSRSYKRLIRLNNVLIFLNILFLVINGYFLYSARFELPNKQMPTPPPPSVVKTHPHKPEILKKDTIRVAERKDIIEPKPEEKTEKTKNIIHTVQTGQTVFSISRMYRVPVDSIKKANKLSGYTITVGMQLIIPPCAEPE